MRLFAVILLVAVGASAQVKITALSTDASRVTGGDVLVEVSGVSGPVKVTADGRDVSAAFRPGGAKGTLVGLVTGLKVGKNVIRAGSAEMVVTDYAIEGPVFSGPRQMPFICQTGQFKLPDGSLLGAPLDKDCSAKTVVQYVYLPVGGDVFRPWKDGTAVPADVAMTTTLTGATVRFIVRVETGTMDRGIYQNAVLHDPTVDGSVNVWQRPKGWNGRLVAVHGSGCPGGWYIQGAAEGVSPLDKGRLAKGYALFTNTLNHSSNSCNAIVAAETTMMGKERFIETFGVPDWTVSMGGSGGAYTSLQVADAFPGLIDGVVISATFPDALAIAMSGLDGHLLMHYFSGAGLSEAQMVAIGGYDGMKAMTDAANQAQRTDPVVGRKDIPGYGGAKWSDAVPVGLRYDAVTNPRGARPTVFDAAKNAYGVDEATGKALRPYDNVGVQYGLNALNARVISVGQFLDLNEKIGGVDADDNYTAARAVGDAKAIRGAYESGLMLSGKGGLASIPVLDNATSTETGGYHYGWFHWALRERLKQANGDAGNMVMWRSVPSATAQMEMMERWLGAVKADGSEDSRRVKVMRAKPADALDGCWDGGKFLADALPFSREPVSACSKLYPVSSNPRHEAGGSLAANVLKCQMKAVDARDYTVPFSSEEMARMKRIFPGGVCDFSKPGAEQVEMKTWRSMGPM